jgi:tripartite-type tricarboxylate transporter receptor subunit TctC
VEKLSKEIALVLNTPDVKQTLISKGVEPVGSSPAEFKAFIEAEMKRYAEAAKNAGIQPQ